MFGLQEELQESIVEHRRHLTELILTIRKIPSSASSEEQLDALRMVASKAEEYIMETYDKDPSAWYLKDAILVLQK